MPGVSSIRLRVPGVSSYDARHSCRARPCLSGEASGCGGVVDTTGGRSGRGGHSGRATGGRRGRRSQRDSSFGLGFRFAVRFKLFVARACDQTSSYLHISGIMSHVCFGTFVVVLHVPVVGCYIVVELDGLVLEASF